MFPLVSTGGLQLRRTNRLETKTGTTSRGAEGRILELGTAVGEWGDSVRKLGDTKERGSAGKCVGVKTTKSIKHGTRQKWIRNKCKLKYVIIHVNHRYTHQIHKPYLYFSPLLISRSPLFVNETFRN